MSNGLTVVLAFAGGIIAGMLLDAIEKGKI